jgi:type I restriction enzyme, S subunit
MSAEWPTVSIGDIAGDWKGSMAVGPFGSRMKADLYVPSGVRVVRGNNLSGGREPEGEYVHVSVETADSLASCCLIPGDLVFPHRGNIGEVGITPDDGRRYMLSTSLMKLSPDRKKVDPLYLMYFFKSAVGRSALLMNASQVGTPGIATPLKSLRSIQFPLPSLGTQKQISETLSKLDDRITLLRETNTTLEAIAQALFKSWFVDFDPVHAKMQGRAPEGMDEATAALFPDSFEESDLGPVPKGWGFNSLDSIATFLNGLALQKFPPNGENDLPVIKIAQLRKGDTVGADLASGSIKNEYIVQNGDVLFSWSGSLEVEIWCGGVGALNQHLFKVTSAVFPKWFYFLWTRQHLENFRQIAASKATTMGHIQRAHLTAAKVIVPNENLLCAANDVIDPILQQIIRNSLRVNTLASLRDSLLPRLISGQLSLETNVSERVCV